jgi:flagellar biosynthesis chaperone FliJ
MALCDRVEEARPLQEELVARAREEFLARRRERLEVETLVAEAEAILRLHRQRQEQRVLDDWFQSRSRRDANRRRR